MKREILFRGKRIDNWEWIYGIPTFDFKYIFNENQFDSHDNYMVIPETVSQFTGLLDKNGKRIFEGDYDQNHDVVMWCDKRNGWAMKTYDFPTREVISCHCFRCEGHFDIDDADFNIEIIGSIHDQNF